MSLKKINKENFDEIINSNVPVLIDFYADWCGPCRMVGPIIEEIAEERDDVIVGKINVDNDPELAERFNVFSIPTIVVLKDGEEVNRIMGARPKAQILSLLEG
ncbi:MAG: thioredoxin [Clostridia bacterium]|nr:thioredoxin [Clostridia bacterium]MBQ6905465.1 thioredoxin [Clostridia bacterium]